MVAIEKHTSYNCGRKERVLEYFTFRKWVHEGDMIEAPSAMVIIPSAPVNKTSKAKSNICLLGSACVS